jgi:hypothetical protein
LKQAAKAFFIEVKKSLTDMNYEQSRIAYCVYFSWTMVELILWITWVDDCCVHGDCECVKAAKEQIKSRFECDDLED